MSFKQIVVADFEYECEAGGLPHVLCMVAHVLNEEPSACADHPYVAR